MISLDHKGGRKAICLWKDLTSGEKIRSADRQRPGQLLNDHDCRIAGAAFDITDIGPMNACFIGKRLLAELALKSVPTDIPAKAMSDIHPAT